MESKIRTYESEDATVTWDQKRCIHFAACVHGLPDVFDPNDRPWVQPENASPEALLATVLSNPEGEVTSGTFLPNATEQQLILQRIDGVGTPPAGIPTGTGGLLPGSQDPIGGLLIAAAGSVGLLVLVGRERLRRS